ncbi:hypothetical protein [Staphylococcus xylosus]|uniref:hypothetical protein n=1 Tax=Staphylococcus xylosus TaxID=1288 RepID=UPI002DB5E389|nr:hypothetical protein [Staphylococcus xylosus]MEB8101056.1 hypothetical protein [Staphylococcus xylosus]
MIKFELKDKKTGKTSTYSKEDITLGEAERFYEMEQKKEKEIEKYREKAKAEIEKEYGSDFEDQQIYFNLIQGKFNEIVDSKKIRKYNRDFFISLFADQGLTEEDVLSHMSTRQYNKALEKTFREIEGEDEEATETQSEEVGKATE